MSMKDEYAKICANCEHASQDGEEDRFFCHKKKKEVMPDRSCHRFFFDLLKYRPSAPREIPTLDPDLVGL